MNKNKMSILSLSIGFKLNEILLTCSFRDIFLDLLKLIFIILLEEILNILSSLISLSNIVKIKYPLFNNYISIFNLLYTTIK